jgi:hypothetical protein
MITRTVPFRVSYVTKAERGCIEKRAALATN